MIKGFSLKVGTLSWQVASAELLEQGGDGALSTAPRALVLFLYYNNHFYRLVFLFTHMNHMKNKKIINNKIHQKYAEQVHSILLT